MAKTFSVHPRLVRDFAHGQHAQVIADWSTMHWAEQSSITLRSPESEIIGYEVRVTFTTFVPRRDDAKGIDTSRFIRIRSSNWRAEDEAFGVFPIEMARNFYRNLRSAGMVPEEL